MRIPFIMKKKPVIPRNPDGTFTVSKSGPEPLVAAKTVNQTLEQEVKTFGTLTEAMAGLDKLLESRDARLAAMLPNSDESALEMSWIGEVVNSPVASILAPAIAPYVPGLIEKYMGVKPNTSVAAVSGDPPPEQPPSLKTPETPDFGKLLSAAANTPSPILKAGMPQIYKQLEERGIDTEVFKKAVLNLSKAIK